MLYLRCHHNLIRVQSEISPFSACYLRRDIQRSQDAEQFFIEVYDEQFVANDRRWQSQIIVSEEPTTFVASALNGIGHIVVSLCE